MTWTRSHPRRKGELEFRFANESAPATGETVRRAVLRHERRHPEEDAP